MDRLAPFFENFSLTARMFYAGRFCGTSSNHETEQAGHLHVLKKGRLKVIRSNARHTVIDAPSILFFPRPRRHRLYASEEDAAEIVCATVEFGAGMLNPLIATFPEPLILPLEAVPELALTLQLLFSEASAKLPGRQASIDRLLEYILILLMRAAIAARLVDSGLLIGLSDSRLSRAIEVMHRHPEISWSLEQLAQRAGMSRARFAAHFRRVVGMTPFDYLTNWRIGIAQTMLRKGRSLKLTAPAVGYANSTSLTRIFTQRLGISPSEWLARSRPQREDRRGVSFQ